MLSLGIDSGSTMTKGVVFDGGSVVECRMIPTSMKPGKIIRDMYAELHTPHTEIVVLMIP